ncbi:MAG TPA: SCO family protein [Acidobacteriota bacterium]|nr:SCO family protein [Acidobacteriota bacterium]
MRQRLCFGGIAALLLCACDGADSASVAAERYELVGTVVSGDAERNILTIAHEMVGDYMTAMTMPFNVPEEWVFDSAAPGSAVRAVLVVQGAESWLEDIVITRPAAQGTAADVVVRAARPGESVPPIEVINQDGVRFGLDEYRGSYFAFTFIYTRCPLPDFCPLMSENFRLLFDAVEADVERFLDLRLLSLSIDPHFDTAEVLRQYGERYLETAASSGFDRWQFASAAPAALKEIGEFTGLRFMPDAGQLLHSLRTALVNPEGAVVRVFVGNTWSPEDLLAALELARATSDGATHSPDVSEP